jgi:hypothetical protein
LNIKLFIVATSSATSTPENFNIFLNAAYDALLVIIASPPMLKLCLVAPSVPIASIEEVEFVPPTENRKIVFVAFGVNCAVSPIHNCLF